jgi:hypothetical protein
MSDHAERKMLELLANIERRLSEIQADLNWFKEREIRRVEYLDQAAHKARRLMPHLPKK